MIKDKKTEVVEAKLIDQMEEEHDTPQFLVAQVN